MSKIDKIINSILLLIMAVCFIPTVIYGLVFIYSKLNINLFTINTFKGYMGDIIIYFITPLALLGIIIYQYFLHKYCKLIALENNEENDNKEKDA